MRSCSEMGRACSFHREDDEEFIQVFGWKI
jgi:hypothetical protein